MTEFQRDLRHPGLDPGSRFFLRWSQEEAGPRLKAGATEGIRRGFRLLGIFLAIVALSACGKQRAAALEPGDRLEAAARAAGLIADPDGSLTGAWARETDRLCVVPGADGTIRIGALVDYGQEQSCAASGTLQRSGEQVRITFGDCRFDARFDGERLTFPGELPAACARACQGRASLAALAVERRSASASEAATLRGPDGRLLCGA